MNLLNQTIGKTIAQYRQDKGLTQDQLAEKLNIGYEAVSRLERGVVMPTVARLVELAEIFECEAADLLMQSSNRAGDQAAYIHEMLSGLAESDRSLILSMVQQLTRHLKKDDIKLDV
ncbi:helix-turn-helix transcriptional regulator [Paralysiella testudinis]|uniref:Helix-turn-helix transcriptional regulator n=2 Tax=Paralysiella testudinis TaxID=2809020 RepID=A0A892ZRD4_9NEIS|nr:helix-turn-helix transcriptional regulator [Paralysiella testudinis]